MSALRVGKRGVVGWDEGFSGMAVLGFAPQPTRCGLQGLGSVVEARLVVKGARPRRSPGRRVLAVLRAEAGPASHTGLLPGGEREKERSAVGWGANPNDLVSIEMVMLGFAPQPTPVVVFG